MARIASVQGVVYRLPLHGSLNWGAGSSLSAAEHVLVRVTLDDGSVGEAEAPPRPTIYGETPGSILGALAYLQGRLVGTEISGEAISNGTVSGGAAWRGVLDGLAANNTAKGALDMALHAAAAAAQGLSLWDTLLGPSPRVRPSFILGMGPLPEMLAEARRVVAAGVRVLKVKVGRNHAHDLRLIRELRDEYGSAVSLYADSNETLTPDTAPAALSAMAEAGLLYVEEPLPVRLLLQRQVLRQRELLRIVADDSCFTPADLERELAFQTFDVLNIKSARNGFSDSLDMLARAVQAGKGVMVGSQASTGLGTLHAALLSTQPGVTEPCELSFVLKLEDDLLDRPITFQDGWLDVAGLREHRLDPAKLERYRV